MASGKDVMRVAVLGATGSVGRLIVAEALRRGHEVTALVRDRDKGRALLPGAQLEDGDALDSAAVRRVVAGQDAVVYALGTSSPRRTTLFSDSTRILLPAMHEAGVRRLVAITGVGAGETKGHGGFLYDWILYPLFTRRAYEDKDRQEALIRATTLDWIIVRPASFRDRTPSGKLQVVTDDVAQVTLRTISRAEVAAFAVDQLESDRYLRRTPFIGHP